MLNFVRTMLNEISCLENNLGLFMVTMKENVDPDLYSRLESGFNKIKDGVSDLEGSLIELRTKLKEEEK